MAFWSILTPAYRSPDEPQHVNSILRVLDGGGWPPAGSAEMSESVLRSRTLAGFTESDGHRGPWGGGTLLPAHEGDPRYPPETYPRFSDQEPSALSERLPFDELRTDDLDGRAYLDQMSQHPPLYYAVQAGILYAVDADALRFDQELAVMRWISASMVVWLPLCGYAATTRLTGSRRLGNIAALLPLGIPQLAHIGASVSNDALVVGLGGLLTVQLAYVLTAGGDTVRMPSSPRRMYWLLATTGVVLGLACFTKGVLLSAVPVTAVAVLVGVRRWADATGQKRPRARSSLAAGGVLGLAGLAGGWWYAVNLLRYGRLQPDAFHIDERTSPRELVGWWEFITTFFGNVGTSFWGWFGWKELPMDPTVTGVLTIALVLCCAAGCAVGFLGAVRFRRARGLGGGRAGPLVLLAFPALTAAALFLTTHDMHVHTGRFPGMQGRYLYGGLAALATVAAIGLGGAAAAARIPLRWVAPAVAVGALVLQGYGLHTAFEGFYVAPGWSYGHAWERMSDWSPWPPPVVIGVAGALVVAAAATVGLCLWSARTRPPTGIAPPPPRPPADPAPTSRRNTTQQQTQSPTTAIVTDHDR